MYSKKVPSADSNYAPPNKARLDKDPAVGHGGSMAHEGTLEGSPGEPKAKGVMGHGEREPQCSGVMGGH